MPSTSPIAIVPGEPRARVLIKGLLGHFERVRHQRWIALDFPEEWTHSKPAVQAIALEDTGRATALDHIALALMTPVDEGTQRLLELMASIEQDATLPVREVHVEVTLALGRIPSRLDLKLFEKGLSGWCVRHIDAAPEGTSAHVITIAGTAVRLELDKRACRGERGRLSMLLADPPTDFSTAVSNRLQARLSTLMASPADRQVLLFEKKDALWGVGHLRTELEASFDFPDLSRVHEIWMADVTAPASVDDPTFRRVLPADD
jgi:hypothetical protein